MLEYGIFLTGPASRRPAVGAPPLLEYARRPRARQTESSYPETPCSAPTA